MGNTFYFTWEAKLMIFLQSHAGTLGTNIASFFTTFGGESIVIFILGFLYWGYSKEAGKRLGTNVITALSLNNMFKNVFMRRRPYFDIDGVECLKPVEEGDLYNILIQGFSFPSGHSVNASATYFSLASEYRKKWLQAIFFCLVILVGISRVFLGVHFPTDVIAGWILGIIVILAVGRLSAKIKKEWQLYLILFAVSAPGLFFCKSDDYFTNMGILCGSFAGFLFESRFVKFKSTRKTSNLIFRTVAGIACYIALNTLFKMPFSSEFLSTVSPMELLIRFIRYTVVFFTIIGIYPLIFRFTDRVFRF